ncbi:MAG: LLM class flavin-dependent oxidoreductase [Novosphingobium sp.]|jgi:alkanesulfonate monooxygenase SsuD/methylene tetrahydromethanopterin reductase-like flavin-dependent oxidoreductase (luciferase family)|uniref:LLM class F420-dependent oxidoreductase n=1 Tax=Novosphingobium indicum TaxID=462949 RepID=A0ABQ2K1A7_9SPHN|nr:LLM class flavin-dependent oxidoreductase [Novosphingobium indicum]MAC59954.1 LLM class flavin-dependent oxidoreductase [Novosphingobium sp.]GGN61067.1 LLM class F420-dependent oxidoreductase [Novosphingobium indicum]
MTKLTNATGGERRWWGVLPVLPAPVLGGMAKQMEQVGFEGCFSLQIYGPPFVPMAAVAAMTDTLKVSTGIAVAGTRSPVETAYAAIELDTISQGRFVLGLGTSLHSALEGIYGEPRRKLLTHLREVVKIVRYVNANGHKEMVPLHGEYYDLAWTEKMMTPPPVREHIPIWIAALKDKLTSLTLEIADGLMVHALWTVDYTVQKKSFIEAELARFGRKRDEVEINAWPWIAINDDKQQAIDDSRATVAGYAGYKEYESFFDSIGFGDLARDCQLAAGEHGDVSGVIDKVSDEMVQAFVKCGPVDDVLEQIEPFWGVVDSLCPMTPYRNLSMEQLTSYNEGLFRMVAEAKRRGG